MNEISNNINLNNSKQKVAWYKKTLGIIYNVCITTIVGALLYGVYIIYVNVAFSLPQQISDINKGNDILRQQFIDNKAENKEQHISFVYRDDKIIDKLNENYSVLLKNIYEIKQKLKMAIDYNEILKKQQGAINDTTNKFTVYKLK